MAQNENFMIELEKLFALGIPMLNDDQLAFIRARRSYLTPAQEELCKDFLDKKVESKPDEGPSMKEIRERAKALNIKIPVGTKKEDALAMVNAAAEAQAPASESKPDEGPSEEAPETDVQPE